MPQTRAHRVRQNNKTRDLALCPSPFDRLPEEVLLIMFQQLWEVEVTRYWFKMKYICDVNRRWRVVGIPLLYNSREIEINREILQLMATKNNQDAFTDFILSGIRKHATKIRVVEAALDDMVQKSSKTGVWTSVASLITVCERLQRVVLDFTRTGAQEASIFPSQLFNFVGNNPDVSIHVQGFRLDENSVLPKSTLSAFLGDVDPGALKALLPQLGTARMRILSLRNEHFSLILERPEIREVWDWSQIESLRLDVKDDFMDGELLEHLQAATFNSLRNVEYKNLATWDSDPIDDVAILTSVLRDTQVKHLEIFYTYPLEGLIKSVIKFVPSLSSLKIDTVSAEEFRLLGTTCAQLHSLTICRVSFGQFDRMDNGKKFFQSLKHFRVLQELKIATLARSGESLELEHVQWRLTKHLRWASRHVASDCCSIQLSSPYQFGLSGRVLVLGRQKGVKGFRTAKGTKLDKPFWYRLCFDNEEQSWYGVPPAGEELEPI